MNPILKTSLLFLAHGYRIGLAVVFLWAGALKGLDPEGFAMEITDYGLIRGWLATLGAYVLPPLEMGVGLALLINFRSLPSLIFANGLLLVFIGAIVFAILTDQPLQSCGCFGKNIARTPEQTLIEDILLLAGGVLAMWILRKRDGKYYTLWKKRLLVVAIVSSSAFTIASPHLPIDDWATSARPGVKWEKLNISLAEIDLSQGDHFVALMSLTEQATQNSIEDLNMLASTETVNVIALYLGNEQAYGEFFWTHGTTFPMYAIAPSDMRLLHRRLPRFLLITDGVIRNTWAMLPIEKDIADALQSERNQ